MKSYKAFSPAGISSFFEICDSTADGKPIENASIVGARGGGFGIRHGVTTEAIVTPSKEHRVRVFINENEVPNARTTRSVIRNLLGKTDGIFEVIISHDVEVPIGAGFGTSAAGALTTAMSLAHALSLDLTFNEIGRIAHVAEIECKTGLGTVGPLMLGGCILTTAPGAPGIAVIDRLLIPPDYMIVSAVLGTTPTKSVLSSPEKKRLINQYGKVTLEKILSEPSVENFMACCLEFAEKTRFMTSPLRSLVKLASNAGAIGVAQNMVGEAIHAVSVPENTKRIVEALRRVLPAENVILSEIDFQGARLLE